MQQDHTENPEAPAPEVQIMFPDSMQPHIEKVLAGEYDLPYEFTAESRSRTILDIGANVGAFAAWAHLRWPGSTIHCYEPLGTNFSLLRENLSALNKVVLVNKAVGNPENRRLFLGRNNCGENSFFDLGEQLAEFEEVETLHPAELPPAAILKIDTEGSEWDILSRLPRIDYDVILLEYHDEGIRRQIDALLSNYSLVGGMARCLHRGTVKYLHNRLLRAP
jgi:FkbM family methyltransferase